MTVFDFTIASQNNIEIKNLRLNATTTGMDDSADAFNDFKVWDVASNAVLSSATDITTSTGVVITDIINISAGQSKRMKVTVDVDADTDADDTIVVSLQDWGSSDIRNLDNNTYAATSTIVPSGAIAGNTQTVKAPSLDIGLSGTGGAKTVVKGATDLELAAFSYRAVTDDIKISSIRVSASVTPVDASGTISTIISDFQNLALYDGTTRVSDFKSMTGSALPGTATFSGLNYTVPKGTTKVLTLKGNLSNNATVGGKYYFYHTSSTADMTVLDSDGNTATITGSDPNYSGADGSVTPISTIAVLNSGDVTVTNATADNESKTGLVVAGTESVLAKFRFTSANEAMTIDKLQLIMSSTTDDLVNDSAQTETYDEVGQINLYDGATKIGGPYNVEQGGSTPGKISITGLNWTIGANQQKTLTVKGVLSAIELDGSGADAGAGIVVHVTSSDFRATGATAEDTALAAASGNLKIVYKNVPVIERLDVTATGLSALTKVAKFRVRNNSSNVPLSFKSFQLYVSVTGATVTAPSTSNVTVYNYAKSSTALTLATVVAASSTSGVSAAASSDAITGGNTGYVGIVLTTEEEIAPNSYQDYDVFFTLSDIPTDTTPANIQVKLNAPETAGTASAAYSSIIDGSGAPGNVGLVWSDHSRISHSESTADWNQGYLIELPSTAWLVSR